MRFLENLCGFIPFFLEIGDSLGRPGGQRLQGYLGWLTLGSCPRRAFVFCCVGLGSMKPFKMFIYTGYHPFISKIIIVSCQGKQWVLHKEFPTLQKWWKLSACDFFPPPRSYYGSSGLVRGTESTSARVSSQLMIAKHCFHWDPVFPPSPAGFTAGFKLQMGSY